MVDILVNTLKKYFEKELPNLKIAYKWKIPNVQGFNQVGQISYDANVELKKYLHLRWKSSSYSERLELAKIIVADWGGVRGNKSETLQSYVDKIEQKDSQIPIKGIASYSKILSITDVDKYAIYDARVAVSLNAIQWNYHVNNGVAFNYIDGRNNITGNSLTRKGFAYHENFIVKNLERNGWNRLSKDETYQFYLKTLHECLRYFPEYKLYDLEMLLFSNAEIECKKALMSF
jgi:hypothetical protein